MQRAVAHLLLSLALSTLATLVLLLTFFFAYAVIWFGFNFGVSAASELISGKALHLSHRWILMICSVFVGILFIENARINREYLDSYDLRHKHLGVLAWAAGVSGALVALLANFNASAKVITDLLFSGPRLILSSVRHLRRGLDLLRADLASCANVLALLITRGRKISANEPGLCPEDNALRLFTQLLEIDGVLLLGIDPPTIKLAEETRMQLGDLFEMRPDSDSSPGAGPRSPTAEEDLTPYEVLGLVPPASLAQIKAAYRTLMKECHPDKFSGSSPELRRFAEERTKAINAAYETLLANLDQSGGAD